MSMYFKSRIEAGDEFAEILFHPYGRSNSVVLALSPSSLLVAKPIAERLQIPLQLLATKTIELPGEFHEVVGTVDQSGEFVFSSNLSEGQIEALQAEYHSYIDAQKLTATHEINELLGNDGFIDKDQLRGKNILIVSDGLASPLQLDAVLSFLKPIQVQRLVAITPVSSIAAIDKLHLVSDEMRILSPKESYMSTDHYYEVNDIPSAEQAQAMVRETNTSLMAQ